MIPESASSKAVQQIACQQVLLEDSSVFSVQWTDLPSRIASGITAEQVYQRYLAAIERQTWGVIVPRESPDGVSFLLAGRYQLLCFGLPDGVGTGDGHLFRLRISGGLLVQPDACERGELLFRVEPLSDDGARITLQLSDYCPLLLGSRRPSFFRRWLYRLTQAAIHRLVTIRFLVALYRELAGGDACVRLVRVQVKQGSPT